MIAYCGDVVTSVDEVVQSMLYTVYSIQRYAYLTVQNFVVAFVLQVLVASCLDSARQLFIA